MSRNLCRTDCRFCEGEVAMVEPERPVTPAETGTNYYPRYEGMLVANAECVDCRAKYLAWTWAPAHWDDGSWGRDHDRSSGPAAFDLSFRSTFNDEPGEDDMPWAVALWMKTASQRARWWIAGRLRRMADWFADYRRDS